MYWALKNGFKHIEKKEEIESEGRNEKKKRKREVAC